jgi:dTDP-glucose pyrophosphorylase
MQDKISHLKIHKDNTLLQAMKQMDLNRTKMLMIFDSEHFIGIVTLGDIQRAIISNVALTATISSIPETVKEFAHSDDPIKEIKQKMFAMRCEYMPVIDKEGELINVIFWNDLFPAKIIREKTKLNLPVIIMAGGKGTRLKPITNILPKPLIPFGDKTILEKIMDSFVENDCHNFYLSVNYKAEIIKNYFNSIQNKNYNIFYFHEEKPLGTAGSLHLLKKKIHTTFFVSNCDILIEQDYAEILEYHRNNNNELTMVAAIKSFPIPYGIIIAKENGLLESIEEKPDLTFKINTGFYILEPHLLNEIPQNEFYHITFLIDKILKGKRRIGVFPISENCWKDIGDWDEYLKNGRE